MKYPALTRRQMQKKKLSLAKKIQSYKINQVSMDKYKKGKKVELISYNCNINFMR